MIWLPEFGVGAVFLTNSDSGVLMRAAFMRKLLEVLFDGRPEADRTVQVAAQNRRAQQAKERERWTVPARADQADRLAARYVNAELGPLDVERRGDATVFDFGEWKSTVASRRNDDGTTSFSTIDPGLAGFEFVVAERDGRRVLVLRDAQHEYFFAER